MTPNINMNAYNAFYKQNKKAVQNFIFKMTHDMMTAEELVNDVFVKVYQNMHKFDEAKASFKTWVYNIASNTTIDYIRKKKLETISVHGSYPDQDGEFHTIDVGSNDANPLEAMINTESGKKLEDSISILSKQQGDILKKLAIGYSYDDIANELALPLGTVKASIHIARTKMTEYFRKPVAA